jgi:hypothetical protein
MAAADPAFLLLAVPPKQQASVPVVLRPIRTTRKPRGTLAMYQLATPIHRLAGAAAFALGLALVGQPVAAQEVPHFEGPALVTSMGQSLDSFQVQLVVKRAGVAYNHDAHYEPDALAEFGSKTLILAVGASLKGFGEAGITIVDELARAHHFLQTAEAAGIPVIVVAIGGGEVGADDLTVQLAKDIGPHADLLVATTTNNKDGLYTMIAQEANIPFVEVENLVGLLPVIQQAFATGA